MTVYRIRLADGSFAKRGRRQTGDHGSIFTTLAAARAKRTELSCYRPFTSWHDIEEALAPAKAEIIEYELVDTGRIL